MLLTKQLVFSKKEAFLWYQNNISRELQQVSYQYKFVVYLLRASFSYTLHALAILQTFAKSVCDKLYHAIKTKTEN